MSLWTAAQLRQIDSVREERDHIDRKYLAAMEENTRLRAQLAATDAQGTCALCATCKNFYEANRECLTLGISTVGTWHCADHQPGPTPADAPVSED